MKINGKNVKNNGYFAYDNCHKIYVCEDNEDIKQAKKIGYDIYKIEDIKSAFDNSCELRFISNWKLTEQYVCQFESAKFEYGV